MESCSTSRTVAVAEIRLLIEFLIPTISLNLRTILKLPHLICIRYTAQALQQLSVPNQIKISSASAFVEQVEVSV